MCLIHLENGIFIFMNSNSKYTWTESVPVHLDWWSNIFFILMSPFFLRGKYMRDKVSGQNIEILY